VFNILDYSALTFPVSVVKESDTWENFPRNVETCMSKEDELYRSFYGNRGEGPRKYKDAPVALQLVGRRFAEEKLLGILERIMDDLKEDEGARSML